MYVEIKASPSGQKHVYLKRSVRVKDKIFHPTVERYGSLHKLEAQDPDFIDKLKRYCELGDIALFKHHLMLIEQKLSHSFAQVYRSNTTHGKHGSHSHTNPANLAANSSPPLDDKPIYFLDTIQQDFIYDVLSSFDVSLKSDLQKELELIDTMRTMLDESNAINVSPVIRSKTQMAIEAIQNLQSLCKPLLHKITGANNLVNVSVSLDQRAKERSKLARALGVVDAVVVAAGIGKRMQADKPKQYLSLDDKCVLEHTVLKLLCSPYVARVIVVINPQDEYFKFTCLKDLKRVYTVYGGAERYQSVIAGLQAVRTPWALVHDAARPFVSLSDIENLLYQVALGVSSRIRGGILVGRVVDTLKQAYAGQMLYTPEASKQTQALQNAGYVSSTVNSGTMQQATSERSFNLICKSLDRSLVYRALTPQLFKTHELLHALSNPKLDPKALTDEASAFEFLQQSVQMIEGNSLNFKITEPSDLIIARALIQMN